MKELIKRGRKALKRDWQLWLIALIPVVWCIIFLYGPMYGLQIAFRDFSPGKGIVGSDWVGLKWFQKFLSDYKFKQIFSNTVILSLYTLVVEFPLPIIFALILNSLRSEKYKKVVQTISYMPHFISLAVMVSILNMIFSPVSGLYGSIFHLLGGEGIPADFRNKAATFRHMYVWSGVWQELGWNAIIYLSALSSVPEELHEAAKIDGASRFKRVLHVDFPMISTTVGIMLILRCGNLVAVGFEKAFLMQSDLNLSVSEVISTFVYRVGIVDFGGFSYGTAIGLFNTLINVTLLVIVNTICKKVTDDEVSLM